MLSRLSELFADQPADDIDAVILTGVGRYFSSGAALGELSPGVSFPCRLSTWLRAVADMNCEIFHGFIHYPKPLFVAANGPSVGAATTFQLLCDANLCVLSSTFHTPFTQLGIIPEGCSTFTFPKKIGPEGAKRMLVDGEKIDARSAKALGFVDIVVEDDKLLLSRAIDFAEEWVSQGKGRATHRNGVVDYLDRLNRREGKNLAHAILSRNFLEKRGIPRPIACVFSPMLQILAKL